MNGIVTQYTSTINNEKMEEKKRKKWIREKGAVKWGKKKREWKREKIVLKNYKAKEKKKRGLQRFFNAFAMHTKIFNWKWSFKFL